MDSYGAGAEEALVVRRYRIFGNYDRGAKARREYKTFERLQQHGIPAPEPLWLDETGAILEIPGIVTSFSPGEQVYEPDDPVSWAGQLAVTLARIHAIPCDPAKDTFLLDSDAEVSWFAGGDAPPGYMTRHPEGQRVWETFRATAPNRQALQRGLVHVDYWAGNILWQAGPITAVLDWEEAAFGDTTYDVAYSLLDMHMLGYGFVETEFLAAYRNETAQVLDNLGFWMLAAAVRPLFGWGDEIEKSPGRERLTNYIAAAFKRLS